MGLETSDGIKEFVEEALESKEEAVERMNRELTEFLQPDPNKKPSKFTIISPPKVATEEQFLELEERLSVAESKIDVLDCILRKLFNKYDVTENGGV